MQEWHQEEGLKMDLVVDANVIFSVLIKSGKTEDLIFNNDLHLFAPEFIFEEFYRYKNYLLGKTQRTPEEFDNLLLTLKKKITLIANEETDNYLVKARTICPDLKDIDYFALALKLNIPIWSNDKELKEKQSIVQVYSTIELLQVFS